MWHILSELLINGEKRLNLGTCHLGVLLKVKVNKIYLINMEHAILIVG